MTRDQVTTITASSLDAIESLSSLITKIGMTDDNEFKNLKRSVGMAIAAIDKILLEVEKVYPDLANPRVVNQRQG